MIILILEMEIMKPSILPLANISMLITSLSKDSLDKPIITLKPCLLATKRVLSFVLPTGVSGLRKLPNSPGSAATTVPPWRFLLTLPRIRPSMLLAKLGCTSPPMQAKSGNPPRKAIPWPNWVAYRLWFHPTMPTIKPCCQSCCSAFIFIKSNSSSMQNEDNTY